MKDFLNLLEKNPNALKFRHAFEFRDESWFTSDLFTPILRCIGEKRAVVINDSTYLARMPKGMEERMMENEKSQKDDKDKRDKKEKKNRTSLTRRLDGRGFGEASKRNGKFVYIRFHGSGELCASDYPNEQLKRWAEKIKKWQEEGLDVYGYFNNDYRGYAIKNAQRLRGYLGEGKGM